MTSRERAMERLESPNSQWTIEMANIIEVQRKAFPSSKVVMIDEYVFHLPDGKPLSRERLQHEIDRIISRMENDDKHIDRFTPHCFRHPYVKPATKKIYCKRTLDIYLSKVLLLICLINFCAI